MILFKPDEKESLKEEEPSLVNKETNVENEIILDFEKKEVKSKPILKVMLPIVSQTYSYAFHCPNLGIKHHQRSSTFIFNEQV